MQQFIGHLTAMRDQLDEALAHLVHATNLLEGARTAAPTPVAVVGKVVKALPAGPSTRKKGRAGHLGGTAKVIFEVIKGGADTMPAIVKAAKVADSAARMAARELEATGHIVREGKSRATRYLVAK